MSSATKGSGSSEVRSDLRCLGYSVIEFIGFIGYIGFIGFIGFRVQDFRVQDLGFFVQGFTD